MIGKTVFCTLLSECSHMAGYIDKSGARNVCLHVQGFGSRSRTKLQVHA